MKELFVVGDIHGENQKFEQLLTSWKCDKQQLVLTGDLIDRGPNSYAVLKRALELKEKYGAVTVGGNHEWMFLNWLDNPEDAWYSQWRNDKSIVNYHPEAHDSTSILYFRNGGLTNLKSFYNGEYNFNAPPSQHANYLKEKFGAIVDFIRSMPSFYEWQDFVCVHAGVDLYLDNWKNTSAFDMCWIREDFHWATNNTDRVFVFGHHPTKYLNDDRSLDVWVSPCGTKLGIDGGAAYGGVLHGLVVKEEVVETYSVTPDNIMVHSSLGRRAVV